MRYPSDWLVLVAVVVDSYNTTIPFWLRFTTVLNAVVTLSTLGLFQ